jgi:hypothetical protein
MNKYRELLQYSDPIKVQQNLNKYLPGTQLYISSRKNKKYMIQDTTGKFIHFGQLPYQDFTKHKDQYRRQRYLQRATHIRGNWKSNPYSPNLLSILLLWS